MATTASALPVDRLKALRTIGFGARKQLEEYLSEIDPDGYYPNCCTEDLRIFIACTAVAKLTPQREQPDYDWIAAGEHELSVRGGRTEN